MKKGSQQSASKIIATCRCEIKIGLTSSTCASNCWLLSILATNSCSLRLLYGLPSAFFNAKGPGCPSVGAGPPSDGAAEVEA